MRRLEVRTYISPYKPIPATAPGWDPSRQATWPATTATLITGPGDAVLVDALMTTREGEALASWIAASGVDQLSTIYITHAHADHFFGASGVLDRFPARLLARAEVVDAATAQVAPDFLQIWESFFPGQIAVAPQVPAALGGDEMYVSGHPLRAVSVGQSDVPDSTVLHLPELNVVVCGDVAYNGIHMWLQGSTPATRAAWLESLDAIEQLSPRRLVAGHKDPRASDDDAARVLDFSRRYLADFDAATAADPEPSAVINAMLIKYPDLGNPYTLWVAANGLGPARGD